MLANVATTWLSNKKVIACAEKGSNREAATKFAVDEKRVREWRKTKDSISANPSKKKMQGGGRNPLLNTDLEGQLVYWIETLRYQNLRVTRHAIQVKALEIHNQSEDSESEFVTSRGWLERFFNRHGFSLRHRTTVGQRLPRDLVPKVVSKVVSFVMHTRRLLLRNRYDDLSCIGNMDKTPLWLDMPGDTTFEIQGTRSIPVRSTGHNKVHFTVVLAAMANGKKLKPFVVLKGARVVAELNRVPGVVVALTRNGWMNEELTKDWVCWVWGQLNFQKRLLVWDAYKCHLMASV